MFYLHLKLTLLNMDSRRGDILQPRKWNELSNDIRINVGTREIVNRIRLLNFRD